MDRKLVLLYNPKAVFFDLPLALLAIGSMLDSSQYEVKIIDGRIEENPESLIQSYAKEAICLGVSVITGAPIKDALHISELAKKTNPNLPIIWGGWHASLFPKQPLIDHDFIDITVQGQGEYTFQELIAKIAHQLPYHHLQGITVRHEGEIVQNAPRKLEALDRLPMVNYDLVEVEKYFKKKGTRQFDYISSIGCFYRCAFCADPFVFGNRFQAKSAEKMLEELQFYYDKYQFTDLNFQDETFFTNPNRIKDFANGIINRKMQFTWAATMRADQGKRLKLDVWKACKSSGLRRLLIGVESGSQEMMNSIKKDIKLPQVLYCADLCKQLDIGVIFPFIVGFPNDTDQTLNASIQLIKQLKNQSPRFETPIFYFKPYPGTQITIDAEKEGFQLPQTTEEWSNFDYIGSSGPWVSPKQEKFFEAFKFFLKLGYTPKGGTLLQPLKALAKWRCEKEIFVFPIEKALLSPFLSKKLS